MASQYVFENVVCSKISACHNYIKSNIDWDDNFDGINLGPFTVLTVYAPLTTEQLESLTILLNAYVDPEVFLVLNRVESYPLSSHFTSDITEIVDNNVNLQTFIYGANTTNDNIVLDGLKTIIEYKCPHVEDFLNITSGSALQTAVSIYDKTREIEIATQNIDIDDIVTIWHNAAVNGETGVDNRFKTIQYYGLMNKNANHDCVWQIRTPAPISSEFTFRCHSLQYLHYNVE
jgi:hypothetical protein